MKPAISVILLTTLIGTGQGLFLAQFFAQLLTEISLLPGNISHDELIAGGALSLLLLIAGLFASFFHLGHPERAWRAAAMWRTSWLSREVIALPLTMASILFYLVALHAAPESTIFTLTNGADISLHFLIAVFGVFAVLALFICTSMIYACLKFLRQWHNPLTVLNFFLMGNASGCTLATVVAVYFDSEQSQFYAACAILLSTLAGICRWVSLWRNKKLRPAANLQSATGIHHPTIRQMAQGAMGGSFNTRAFIHTYSAAIVKLARRYFLGAAFVVPVVLLLLQANSTGLWVPVIAFTVQYTGLLAERWYFFIEADHPQNAYYQMIS